MEYVPDLVITHFPCSDGATSEAIVKLYFDGYSDIEYLKGNYSEIKDMDDLIDQVRNKNVLMVDFSFKPVDIKGLMTSSKSIVILDHHVTAQSALEEYTLEDFDNGKPNIGNIQEFIERQKCIAIFDMKECGASLAWKFFYPDKDVPLFVERIKDIDLGRHSLPNSSEFMWFTRSLPLNGDSYKEYLHANEASIGNLIEEGKVIKRYVDNMISNVLPNAKEGNIGGVSFKWVITDYAFASEVASHFVRNDGYELGVAAYFTKDTLGLSLRSSENVDCSSIAKALGGGGHKQAAGVNIPYEELPSFLEAVKDVGIDL